MSVAGSATRRELRVGGAIFDYYSLVTAEALGLAGVARLPCSLKVVLENVLRQHAEGRSDGADIAAVAGWLGSRRAEREIAFRFTRVLMPDSSGVPLLGDLAAMRDAMIRLGGDPRRLNPSVPVDLIVDHSAMVDAFGTPDAASRNAALEFERNGERYAFLRWGAQAFDNLRIVPPGNGICHQVNLERLARVVWTTDAGGGARPGDRVPGLGTRDGQPHRDDQQPRHPRLGRRRPRRRGGRARRVDCHAGPGGDRLPAHRKPEARGHRDRRRAHRDAGAAAPQGGGQVRRVLRARGRRRSPCPTAPRSPT